MEKSSNDKLLKYFNVKNHEELINYLKNNPKEVKTIELKNLLNLLNINIDSSKGE